MGLLNRFRSSKTLDWWLTSPDAASETSTKGLHFKGEPNREVDGPENVHIVSIGCRHRVVAITACMQQTCLFLPVWAFGIQTCRFTVKYDDRIMVGSWRHSYWGHAPINVSLHYAWSLYSCTDTGVHGEKQCLETIWEEALDGILWKDEIGP